MPAALYLEREPEVLADAAHRRAGQGDGGYHPVELAAHQRDIRGLDGHVGAGADGDADIGLGQGWGVVDPVIDHGDLSTGGLEAGDLAGA